MDRNYLIIGSFVMLMVGIAAAIVGNENFADGQIASSQILFWIWVAVSFKEAKS